jgi:hypothetical protein
MNAEEIASKIGAKSVGPRRWKGICPCHNDRDPSLDITEKGGKPLVICRAGCEQAAVIEALRQRGASPKSEKPDPHFVCAYDYRDENDKLLYQVVRKQNPKKFPQRRPDGVGGWIWDLGDVQRVLYRLQQLLTTTAKRNGSPPRVYVAEGEKDCNRLTAWGLTATTCPGGAGKWRDEYSKYFAGCDVVILGDNDETGREHVAAVAASVAPFAASVRIPDLGLQVKGADISNWIDDGGMQSDLETLVNSTSPVERRDDRGGEDQPPIRRLKALTVAELLTMDIPEREMLLAPIIPAKGLVEFYSKRGVGKTFVALCIAYAVASGGAYLRWKAPAPRKVLVVDGEMPLITLKERLATIAHSNAIEPPSPDYIRIIASDHQEFGIPDLSTKEGVEAIEEHISDGVDLVILDNLSTLCRGGKENESESWVPIQEWMLSLRRRGISVLFVQHAGKGGAQRGTSKREDVLDTVVVLRHPDDYTPADGARFEVHLDKARGVYGDQAKPFEAQLTTIDDVMTWTMRDLKNVEVQRAADLKADGFSVRDIAEEMGMSKSAVDRLLKKSGDGAAAKLNGSNPWWVDT